LRGGLAGRRLPVANVFETERLGHVQPYAEVPNIVVAAVPAADDGGVAHGQIDAVCLPSFVVASGSLPRQVSDLFASDEDHDGIRVKGVVRVQRDTIANRALNELMHHYTVAEEKSGLVLTTKAGDTELFLHDLDDLHQLDFVHNQEMVKEIERLRVLSTTIEEQRESWKVRALMAEAQLLEATVKTSNNDGWQKVTDVRYVSLKRYLAKRFHPDYAPGQGFEKIVRNEIFKEIWNEVDRLDQGVSVTRVATARSSSAA
jgi:hypothetical protein